LRVCFCNRNAAVCSNRAVRYLQQYSITAIPSTERRSYVEQYGQSHVEEVDIPKTYENEGYERSPSSLCNAPERTIEKGRIPETFPVSLVGHKRILRNIVGEDLLEIGVRCTHR
jgi:hypothetical protein